MNNNLNTKEFYTLEQLSEEININITSLREFIKKGKLNASKIGNRYIVDREDIKEMLKNTRRVKNEGSKK